ncbi:hypothetical protein SAMN05421820_102276 [Pedobacter steynii]|uniref:Uncharacterized protein n=2 Tax=Pedobacter steynii TaxID=430522 RepID=A0A1G9NBK5_9SPHI|nr:hypothetical protein SAMN05421820_102276 [Pedobacter steynii]
MALFIVVLGSACTKSEPGIIACTLEFRQAYMNFNVVDGSTGKDLFFSDNPKYTVDEIGFFKTKDKLFKEVQKPVVIGTGTQRYFRTYIDNFAAKDTLLMKLPVSGGNEAADVFSYTMKTSKEPCSQAILDKAKLNNVDIVETNGKLIIRKIQPVN